MMFNYICITNARIMSQSTISIRVDQDLKKNFDTLCESFGLSTSAAFNIFMKAVVRERKIPFEIRSDSKDYARVSGLNALAVLRKYISESNVHEMSLDEINSEIKAARDERKQRDIRCN